jgi:glycosyltransferase involved in cell wall biosynthesis
LEKRQTAPRILQIFKYYHPNVGGVEKVARDIAEGLRGKIDTKILASHENTRTIREPVNGIDVTRAGRLATYFSVPLAPRFPFLMRSLASDRDILHFHLPYPLADVSYLLARPHGRVVVWWHSEIVRPEQLTRLYRPLLRRFLGKVDRIIVAAPQLVERSPFLSQFSEKCRVIPIGIDTDRFQQNCTTDEKSEEIHRKYGRKIVLFVGRLIYYKGVNYLVEAMAHLADKETTLLVVGEGPLMVELQTLAAGKGVTERVVFLGKVSDEELLSYFQACDLFVLPSTANTEAFGIVQLEAMACGKPVVSTDLPTGVPFVNLDRTTGIIVPPANARALADGIGALLNDRVLAQKYGEAGRRRVGEEFTVEVMLKRVLRLYEEIMAIEPGRSNEAHL